MNFELFVSLVLIHFGTFCLILLVCGLILISIINLLKNN